jgi:hypothetical protein
MREIVALDANERAELIEDLQSASIEFLIAYDEIDEAIKWKVNGGIWVRPMGRRIQ